MIFYNIALHILQIAESIHGLFNKKTRERNTGVEQSYKEVRAFKQSLNSGTSTVWFHCASLGEFDQAKPLIDRVSKESNDKVVISFYSPSGYNYKKKYEYADLVFYLPVDTQSNAKKIIQLLNPQIAIFVKYEFWFNYLNELKSQNVPTIFISTIIRHNHYIFNKVLKSFTIPILQSVHSYYVQDDYSKKVLNKWGMNKVYVTGDTRVDSVMERKMNSPSIPFIRPFIKSDKVLVIGSSWAADDRIYSDFVNDISINSTENGWKIIIAPHEIHEDRITGLQQLFLNSITYSELKNGDSSIEGSNILIIDNIGMLASLYQYADVVYIGGGFGTGIHNTLEPAVYGVPILFGPKYEKFFEAQYFVDNKLAYVVHKPADVVSVIRDVTIAKNAKSIEMKLKDFFRKNKDATHKIYEQCKLDKLLR